MNTILSLFVDEENSRRKDFANVNDSFPKDVIPGLDDKVPLISIQAAEIDPKLPFIDKNFVEDVPKLGDQEGEKVLLVGNLREKLKESFLKSGLLQKSEFLFTLSTLYREEIQKKKKNLMLNLKFLNLIF